MKLAFLHMLEKYPQLKVAQIKKEVFIQEFVVTNGKKKAYDKADNYKVPVENMLALFQGYSCNIS